MKTDNLIYTFLMMMADLEGFLRDLRFIESREPRESWEINLELRVLLVCIQASCCCVLVCGRSISQQYNKKMTTKNNKNNESQMYRIIDSHKY